MILTKYLSREVFKSQVAILLILLLIFFSQQLVRILGSATTGKVPTDLVFSLLGLGVPTMIQLILPLSLFLALLMTLGRLYAESEITVMTACGVGQKLLVKVALLLALFTAIFAAYNTFYLAPLSLKEQKQLLDEAKANPSSSLIAPGQFVTLGKAVLFVNEIHENDLQQIYVFQQGDEGKANSVVVAKSGQLQAENNGDQLLTLTDTHRTEGLAGLKDFRLTHFERYDAYLDHKAVAEDLTKDEEMLGFNELFHYENKTQQAELHWRLTLVFAVPIMALIAIALSKVNPRQGRFAKILPALLIYLIYFLLQTSLKSAGVSGKLDVSLFIPLVNIAFLLFGIGLNSWNSPMVYQYRMQKRLSTGGNQ